jgi:membrane protein DedA with SNARE-associated domain
LDAPELNRLRTAVLALLGFVTLGSLLGTALAPYLLVEAPLLLVAISPAAHHVVLAAASADPVPLVLLASVRRVVTCVAAYGLGYFYGRGALGWVEQRHPRLARFVGWVERLFARFGVWLLVPAPTPTVALFAGATRTRFIAFVLATFFGQILWNSVTVTLGDALSVWTDRLTTFLRGHLVESTLVCMAAVALKQVWSRFLRRRRQSALPLSRG